MRQIRFDDLSRGETDDDEEWEEKGEEDEEVGEEDLEEEDG